MDNDIAKQLFLEQASAFYDDLKAAVGNASFGKVLDKAEHFVVTQGRELLHGSLETIMQEQINEVGQEQKKRHNVLLRRNAPTSRIWQKASRDCLESHRVQSCL